MSKKLEKLQIEANYLSEEILINNLEEIKKHINNLIRAGSIVRITCTYRKYICDSHSSIFPNEPNHYTQDKLLWAINCEYRHKFCAECIKFYVNNNFATNFLNSSLYECIYCNYYGVQGSLLFEYDSLRFFAASIFSEEYILALENYKREEITYKTYNTCSKCNKNYNQLIMICLLGHQICHACLRNYISSLGNRNLRCFDSNCTGSLSVKVIIENFANDDLLFQIKSKLEVFGFYLTFCPTCNKKIDLYYGNDGKTTETFCHHCKKKMCNNCKRVGHFGKTCFYFESKKNFEVINLYPPKDVDRPQNLKEQEYLNAKYAFEGFLENPGPKFKSAKLIVNKPLEDRYALKKQAMAKECGGKHKINEVYIWHGSKRDLYDTIMKDGLKVGGVDGIPISQGAVHGLGVYCSTTPDTPMQYASDSKYVLACLAMKGNRSPQMVTDVSFLNTGKYHSYKPKGDIQKNWQVIFTKEQILPRFLIEYT